MTRRGRDGAVYLTATLLCLAVPWLLHGLVGRRTYANYHLMWENLLGAGYRMPIDTPQPLLVLRGGLSTEWLFWGVAAAAFAALTPLLGRLSERLWGRYEIGLVAFALVALGNTYVLPGPFLTGYWPLVYFPMVVASVWLSAAGRYGWALALMALSGLLRPESWGFVVGLLGLIWWLDREKWRPAYLWALACVPLWIGFDVMLAGDPLYSYMTVTRYRTVMPADTVGFWGYLPTVLSDVASYVSPWVLGFGAASLGLSLTASDRAEERRGHCVAALVALLPLLGFWGASLFTDIFVHVRFLAVSWVVLFLYAAALPVVAWRWRKPWVRSVATRWGSGVVWASVLLLLANPIATWELTRERSREAHVKRETRDNAMEMLREDWVDTELSLLTGRSIEVFSLTLGPEASRRMHQLRVVGADPTSIQRIAPGLYVGISNDMGGYASRFQFLEEPQPHSRYGVRFLPHKVIQGPDGANGLAYRYVE